MQYSGIGGQAVLEGIMMKNKDNYATAVRKPDGEIVVKKDTYVSMTAVSYTHLPRSLTVRYVPSMSVNLWNSSSGKWKNDGLPAVIVENLQKS